MQQQQQQQQPPHVLITTEQIQKYLDQNKQLILAIMETQNLGKMEECAQYQTQLQKNLMYLAAIADAQPPPSTGPAQPQSQAQAQPQPQLQMPVQSTMPQSPFMMPPKPAVTPQQTTGPRLPFALQSFDQQSAQMQYQQSMAMSGGMGMRMGMGINNGLLPGTHGGFNTPTRGRQDGSEASRGN